jgi:phosphoribosylglycinamide formyltransferase 1
MARLPLGVLISGTGTNLGAILDAIEAGTLNAEVRLVVSNNAGAGGLERARRAGVPTQTVSHRDFGSREAFDTELVSALRGAGVEWVVLAGFMRIVTPVLLDAFPMRVLNIHPALLPAFPGTHAQAQALAYGVKVTGCTVHLVDRGIDTGPIVAQAPVVVEDDDDEERLRLRILAEEHRLLVSVLRRIAAGELRVEIPSAPGERARVSFLR